MFRLLGRAGLLGLPYPEDGRGGGQSCEVYLQWIIDHQDLGFLLADMAAAVESARATYLAVARPKDAGRAYRRQASIAGLVATDDAMRVTTDAVQVLGGADGSTRARHGDPVGRDVADVVGGLILLLGVAAVTNGCVVASRRRSVQPRGDDHAASRPAQRKATARRDEFKAEGPVPTCRSDCARP